MLDWAFSPPPPAAVEGPTGNNPLTGDGQIIDIAFNRVTEKGREALSERPSDEQVGTSQILVLFDVALAAVANPDDSPAGPLAQLAAKVRSGGLTALRTALLSAAGTGGSSLMMEVIHLLTH